jgi:hypothetical protein
MGSPTARGLRSPKPHIFTVSLSVLLALMSVDVFRDSDPFDESAPYLPPSDTAGAADPLTVSFDDASPRLPGERVPRRAVYVIAALLLLVVVVLALHASQPSPERHPLHGTARSHHVRPHAPRPRKRTVMHRRATAGRAPIPVSAAKAVVGLPSRNEVGGTGRPNSALPVGNTGQFGYLGR